MTVSNEANKTNAMHQTLGALVVATIAAAVCMVLAKILIRLGLQMLTDDQPEIINFSASIFAGAIGVLAAQEACDRLFKHHSLRVVFGLFALWAARITFFQIALVAPNWGQVSYYAQAFAILATAYSVFWCRAPAR